MKHLYTALLSLLILSNCAMMPAASTGPGTMLFAVTGLRSADMNTETQPTTMEIDFTGMNGATAFTQALEFAEGRWIAYGPELAADVYRADTYRIYSGTELVATNNDIDFEVEVNGGEAVLFPESIILFRDIDAKGGFKPFGFGIGRWETLINSELEGTDWTLVLPDTE